MKSWFEDQIEERKAADSLALEESFQNIAGVVLGRHTAEKIQDEMTVSKQAFDLVLKYYHLKPFPVPGNIVGVEEQLDYIIRHYGLMKRRIVLKEGWYTDAFGPILGFTKEGNKAVALIPNPIKGYYYIGENRDKKIKINKGNVGAFKDEAYCFYRPLPEKKLGIKDLLLYLKSCISLGDIVVVEAATVLISLVGLLLPKLSAALTGPVLNSRSMQALIGISIFIFCIALSTQIITSINGLLTKRIEIKTSLAVESAMMIRILTLPVSFHRKYSPGELMSRSTAVNEICSLLQELFMSTGLTAVASLIYITQIFRFAPALVVPSLLVIIVTVVTSTAIIIAQTRISKKIRQLEAKESGMSYSIITGIQKIKLAGAEKRIFAKWLNEYARSAELSYNPPTFLKISNVITLAINLFSTIILYYMAIKSGITVSAYFGFMAAYGSVMGAFNAFSNIALSLAQIRPILEMAEPFLNTVPECSESKEIVTEISGNVEMAHVSFKYNENGPYILDDVSLKIKDGDYVAIVGRTGCGKSTFVRLLLGFETPEKGGIYYDGRDLNTLDKASLRKNIGTVTQDGGLFQGDIYSNIVITNPSLTIDDAWQAAETAKIADDIKGMPMGMFTMISEGQGGVSGGQKQRLMIARAIAPRPKLLIFDEATSALDNVTQRQISEALDGMGCTRIVVAHRLSTIKHCDRIIVLDKGHIIEDGTYDELIKEDGFFAELVARQRLDS